MAGIVAAPRPEIIAVGVVAVAALVLRLINLNAGLWYDEALTLTQSVRLPPAELIATYGSLNNHVLYTWLAKASVALFGEDPWALRAPAVLFGVGSIIAAWMLFRETGYRWAAIVAAALLAVSYHHVWFSQNARGYTGLLLFTTIAAFALHRALTARSRRYWLLYAASFAAAMLIHLSAAFLLVAQGLAVLLQGVFVERRKPDATFGRWIAGPLIGFGVGSVIVLAVFLPMLGGMAESFAKVAGADGSSDGVVQWKNPIWTLVESVRSFGAAAYAVPLAAGFAAIGVWRMLKSAPWIAGPYLIHIPLTLAILSALSMRIWPRYFFIDIAFFMAAVVIGAFVFADFASNRIAALKLDGKILKVAGSAVMIALSIPLLLGNYRAPKQDFESAYDLVRRERRPGDQAATLGLAGVYFRDYRALDWPALSGAEELTARAKSGVLWVVTAFPAHTRAYFPDAQAVLDADFVLEGKFKGTLSGGDVLVYRSREQ